MIYRKGLTLHGADPRYWEKDGAHQIIVVMTMRI